jgi:hypothetical protein
MMAKDSELFKPLVRKADKYLRDYCNGKQDNDERARFALRVLSVYRRILKIEKERDEIRLEWKKLLEGATELRRSIRPRSKQPKKGKK